MILRDTAPPRTDPQPADRPAAPHPDSARVAALLRENVARARAFDAGRRGDFHQAARWRDAARRAMADRLDLPDPAVDELGLRLERLTDRSHWCREMEQQYRGNGEPTEADVWMSDAATAEADAHRLRETVGQNWVKGLRWAVELHPAAVLAVPLVAELLGRLADVEAAVVELADGRGVRL